jgi:hypothetical protein
MRRFFLAVLYAICIIGLNYKGLSVTVETPFQTDVDGNNYNIFNLSVLETENLIVAQSPWIDVKAYGAVGDGATDDTTALQNAINAAQSGNTILFPPGTYLTNALTTAVPLRFCGYGAKLLRKTINSSPLLSLTDGSIAEGFEIDGQKSITGGSKSDCGIGAGNNTLLKNLKIHDCAGHGVRVWNNISNSPTILNNIISYDNGLNPGASGTGDGIYLINSLDTQVINCNTYGNARIGIVVTTYPEDPTLSQNVTISNCIVNNNSYNQINLEEVSFGLVEKCSTTGAISFRNSKHMTFVNCRAKTLYGSDNTDFTTIKSCNLSAGTYAIYITGKEALVEGCRIIPEEPVSSNMVYIFSTDYSGTIKDCIVEDSYNGFVTNVETFHNNKVFNATNIKIKHTNAAGGVYIQSNDFSVKGGRRSYHSTICPVSGSWNIGDIVYNSSPIPDSYFGWICVSPGIPGVWKGFGKIEL